MSDLGQELEKVILKAGIDGALTEDAVAKFHALVKERDSLKTSLEHEEKVRKEEAAKAARYHEQLAGANEMLSNWATREQELKDRENECTRNELLAEYNQLRVQDHKDMFATVFKGMHMRKQVVTPASTTVDQYGTRQNDMPDTTPVEEQE